MIAHAPPLSPLPPHATLRYVRAPAPLEFPEEAEVSETQLHLDLRTLIYHLLWDYLGEAATVGSDQFVYWAADDPRQKLAPDAYAKLSPRGAPIRSWKTWERGAPDVAVEIVSDSDSDETPWEEKLAWYHRVGVRELVRFDPVDRARERLRIWDRVEGDLVERTVERGLARSLVLAATWVVAPAEGYESALRIARDGEGVELVATRTEAREAAERRIAALEAELLRRGG